MCDAGGGTVDLISYEVVQVEPELKIAEIVVGSGGNCGSTFIDTHFQHLLERRLGSYLQKVKLDKRGPGSKLMNEFEIVKRAYGSGSGSTKPRYLTLNVADKPAAGIEDGEFELSEYVYPLSYIGTY